MSLQKPYTARDAHVEVQTHIASLEALQTVGRSILSLEEMPLQTAVAYTSLVSDSLVPAGVQPEVIGQAISGVQDPRSQVELIMTDIVAPQLTKAETIEERLAAAVAADGDQVFTTRDQMTASNESLANAQAQATEISAYGEGLKVARELLVTEGVSLEHSRPVALYFLSRGPDALAKMGISLEELGQTQVLGDLTDAVDRISAVVEQSKAAAEAKVTEAQELNTQLTEAVGEDWTDRLFEHTRSDAETGVVLDEGVQQSADTNGDAGAPPARSDDPNLDTNGADDAAQLGDKEGVEGENAEQVLSNEPEANTAADDDLGVSPIDARIAGNDTVDNVDGSPAGAAEPAAAADPAEPVIGEGDDDLGVSPIDERLNGAGGTPVETQVDEEPAVNGVTEGQEGGDLNEPEIHNADDPAISDPEFSEANDADDIASEPSPIDGRLAETGDELDLEEEELDEFGNPKKKD